MNKRALISVSDKTQVVEFARELVGLGFELISTGGTAAVLQAAGLPVTPVSRVTGFPEILDGRVKTLHPKIHGGILARSIPSHLDELSEHHIDLIDLVVVNLYPFQETISMGAQVAEAVEQIDIGGPTMVRAAAKNFERVTVVVEPADYPQVLAELREFGEVTPALRKRLAAAAFSHTSQYDNAIAAYLQESESLSLTAIKSQDLRYGENPIQKGALYRLQDSEDTLAGGKQLHGKELSYNNWVDMDAAWSLVWEFSESACVIVKHTNPCGAAVGVSLEEAYKKALAGDPVSAFGGIIACNRLVDEATAQLMAEHFYEVIVAPGFTQDALDVLTRKKNLRLFMAVAVDEERWRERKLFKAVDGGLLVQDWDLGITPPSQWQVVSRLTPDPKDLAELEFAWKVVKHVKSNAIVVTKNGQTIGVGAGQMNRVGAARIALEQAGDSAQGAYLASDAFFPFPDTVEAAAKAGIRAIVQPGGSVRDQESITAVDEAGLIMLFTGRRHFKH